MQTLKTSRVTKNNTIFKSHQPTFNWLSSLNPTATGTDIRRSMYINEPSPISDLFSDLQMVPPVP